VLFQLGAAGVQRHPEIVSATRFSQLHPPGRLHPLPPAQARQVEALVRRPSPLRRR